MNLVYRIKLLKMDKLLNRCLYSLYLDQLTGGAELRVMSEAVESIPYSFALVFLVFIIDVDRNVH